MGVYAGQGAMASRFLHRLPRSSRANRRIFGEHLPRSQIYTNLVLSRFDENPIESKSGGYKGTGWVTPVGLSGVSKLTTLWLS